MTAWNGFRIVGDCAHLAAKCILIFAIHRNRSAEGVSLITQVLYGLVFFTRYTDFFSEEVKWNLFFKSFYILSSLYTVGIMQWIYPRSRERELAWKIGAGALGGSLILSPFVMLIIEKKAYWAFRVWLWDFSEILESVCVLPQLLLLRQTTVPTVINSFYLLGLGSYRGFYLLGWITRGLDKDDSGPNAVSVIFGIVQTVLYIDFAWVYYTRQRVKLRNGGIVDADDLSRGWFLHRIFKRDTHAGTDDEESAPALGGSENRRKNRPKWGARGISVSADEGVLDADHTGRRQLDDDLESTIDPDAKMKDPDELAKALDDEDDGAGPSRNAGESAPSGISNGQEWREN